MTPSNNKAERQEGKSSSDALGCEPSSIDRGQAGVHVSEKPKHLEDKHPETAQGPRLPLNSSCHPRKSAPEFVAESSVGNASEMPKPLYMHKVEEDELLRTIDQDMKAGASESNDLSNISPLEVSAGPFSVLSVSVTVPSGEVDLGKVQAVPSTPSSSISLLNNQNSQLVATLTPRRMQSSQSAHSSNDSHGRDSIKEEGSGSEGSNAMGGGFHSRRSGVTPPLETSSISSEPQVPTTVEVPAQPKLAMTRPASAPHSMSKMHSTPQTINVVGMAPLQPHTPLTQAMAQHKPRQVNTLRRGKWTVEEEAYVARVIQDFNSGYLNAPAGTTLRSYLSDKLHCDPMRITKKFTGDACIGKRVFHPAVRCPSNTSAIDKAQAELEALERRWRRRLEMQQRESAKKAAASAAAAAAAASGRGQFQSPPTQPSSAPPTQTLGHPQQINQSIVTQTASWLDRANTILSAGQISGTNQTVTHLQPPVNGGLDHAQAVRSLPAKEIEDQMKEVQRLIHEGPIIQQTTAGLPNLLDQKHSTVSYLDPGYESPQPPVDKRARHSNDADVTSGAADAEALVGFLNSVRAAAAAGDASHPS